MFYLVLFILIFEIYSDNIRLYDTVGHIEFTQVHDYNVKISNFEKEIPDFFIQNAFVSVKVKIKTDGKEKTEPVRIYGKLNSQPKPEDNFYDKKDKMGIYDKNTETYLYGFEYSPCQLSLNDTIYIKLVGIEGKSNYTLTVNYNYMRIIKFFVPKENSRHYC